MGSGHKNESTSIISVYMPSTEIRGIDWIRKVQILAHANLLYVRLLPQRPSEDGRDVLHRFLLIGSMYPYVSNVSLI